MELSLADQIMLWTVAMAFVLGVVASRTNFCTMGAVSDWVNMGDTARMRSWFLALAVAVLGVALFQMFAAVDVGDSRVPYRTSTFFWPRYILGGLMFGVGMTLASGCGNKNLLRIGGGNIKSILVVLVVGAMAYLMTRTDFYGMVFHSWMLPISPDLAKIDIADQSLGGLLAGMLGVEGDHRFNVYFGFVVSLLVLFFVFRSKEFRVNGELVLAGLVIGLVVLGGWYVTGGPMSEGWIEEVEFMDDPSPGVGVQSFTFINPTGDLLVFLAGPWQISRLTFGLVALLGVILGAFIYALVSRTFRIEWFASVGDFVNHMMGAVLMGIGGVLAMGCTIGQGITGVSTLAIGSFISMGAIILGSALTMKVQLYRMVYEEEASYISALVTGLVDLNLLSERFRKLDAV